MSRHLCRHEFSQMLDRDLYVGARLLNDRFGVCMVGIFEDIADPAVPLALLIGDNQYAGKEPCPLLKKVFIAFTAYAGIAVCHPQCGIPVG